MELYTVLYAGKGYAGSLTFMVEAEGRFAARDTADEVVREHYPEWANGPPPRIYHEGPSNRET